MRTQRVFLPAFLFAFLAVLASALVPTSAFCQTAIDTPSGSTYYYYHTAVGLDGLNVIVPSGDFTLNYATGRVYDLSGSGMTDTNSINANSDFSISVENQTNAEHLYGLYLSNAKWNLLSGGNTYSFTVTDSDSTVRSSSAIYLDSASATNYGTITVDGTGSNASSWIMGVRIDDSTFTNEGSISVNAKGVPCAVYVDYGGSFVNHGTLSATSTSATAFAVYATGNASVELGTGTVIENGRVFSNSAAVPLTVSSNSADTLSFELDGAWGNVYQTGSTTWELLSGSDADAKNLTLSDGTLMLDSGAKLDVSGTTTVNSGATLSLYEGSSLNTKDFLLASGGTLFMSQGADASWLLVTSGDTTLQTGSSLVVSPTSEGTLNLILATGGYPDNGATLSVDSANPNYTLSGMQYTNLMGAYGMTTEATYAPAADQASQSLQSGMAASQSFASVATGRSINLLSNVMGGSLAGAGASGDNVFSQDEGGNIMVASSGDLSGLLNSKAEEPTWAVYAEPVVGTGHRGIVNGQGYDSAYVGVQFGVDRFLNPNLLVGFTGGIGYVDIDFTGDDFYSKDTEQQTLYIAGAYVGYKWNGFSFIDLLSNTYVTHDSRRHATATDYAVGDYSSNIMVNEMIGAYSWDMNETWTLMPHLGYRISRLTRGAFKETDSANAIQYDDYQKIFHDVTAGARVTGHFTLGDYALAPYAGLGMTLALGDNDISVTQTLVGTKTSSRVTTGNDDTQFAFETGCTVGDGPFKVTLGYEGSRSDNEHNHSLSALFRWQY